MRCKYIPNTSVSLGVLGVLVLSITIMTTLSNRLNFQRSSQESRLITDCITKRVLGNVPVNIMTDPFEIKYEKVAETAEQRQASFRNVFKSKLWGEKFDKDYKGIAASGPGSTLRYSQEAMAGLHIIIAEFKQQHGVSRVKMLDIPCGDMAWMSRFLQTRDDIDYTGMDIVPEIIGNHTKDYAKYPWKFVLQDIAEKPLNQSYDIIFSRMMLQHLHNQDVLKILKKFSDSGSRLLLTTSFNRERVNIELQHNVYRFRTVNLEIPPFSLVPPRCLFRDGEGINQNHFLGLWEMPLRKVSGCKNVTAFELKGRGGNIYSCTDWSKKLQP